MLKNNHQSTMFTFSKNIFQESEPKKFIIKTKKQTNKLLIKASTLITRKTAPDG